MDIKLVEMEKQLLKDPFNTTLRLDYANALIENDLRLEAIDQLNLLLKSEPDNQVLIEMLNENELICDKNKIDKKDAKKQIKKTNLSLIDGRGPFRENIISLSKNRKVRFSDIAGMENVKKIIKRKIIEPFLNPSLFQRFKKQTGGGILLYGPPGCGKTMIANAIATECEASFYAIGISDILNMFIGESESQLASVFDRARSSKPAVIFFDELDALAYSRSKANSDHTRTLVNEFLNQLDSVNSDNEGLLILGATNMPWDVDDAMKRPGRFDKQVFVPPLDEVARAELLKIKLIDVPCDNVDTVSLSKACKYFSGADIDALIESAKDRVLDDLLDGGADRGINQEDFIEALNEVMPSTIDWLKTARNLVKFGNAGGTYKEVEIYLRSIKL